MGEKVTSKVYEMKRRTSENSAALKGQVEEVIQSPKTCSTQEDTHRVQKYPRRITEFEKSDTIGKKPCRHNVRASPRPRVERKKPRNTSAKQMHNTTQNTRRKRPDENNHTREKQSAPPTNTLFFEMRKSFPNEEKTA